MFNGSSWVTTAIRSVLGEPEVKELIVVDDCSSDASVKVALGAMRDDTRARILRHKQQRGVAAARNTGIQASRSRFIRFIDQDDRWAPGSTYRLLERWSENAEPCFVIGRQEFQLQEGLKRPSWFRPEWLNGPQPGYVFGATLVTRETFLNIGLLDESLTLGTDDVDWFARTRSQGIRKIEVDDTVLIRTIHGANASANPMVRSEILMVIRRKISETS